MDDIVFANRNKAYGAYYLRKIYDNHIARSLIIGSLFAIVALSTPIIAKLLEGLGEKEDKFVMKEVTLEPPPPIDPNEPPPPPPPEIPPPPRVDMVRFLPPEIKPDNEVKEEEPPPTQDELKEATPSDVTVKGDPNAADVIPDVVVDEKKEEVEEKKDEIFTAVEIPPTPQGGMAGFTKYLQKTLQYPKAAQRANIGGKVFVQFVVSETGHISNVSVIKGIGFGCDEEAIRVVSQAPPWNPGKQGGRAVKVRYTLPIAFTLQQ
jgi:protein TonB